MGIESNSTLVEGMGVNASWKNETNLCQNHEAWGTAIVILESTLIIIGNLFVLLVFLKYPSKRFKPLNYFITQLALADLCIGVIVLWIGFLSAKIYSYVSLISGIFVYGLLATATSASTLSVLFIAIDRYIYILMHQKYKKIMKRSAVFTFMVLSWLLPSIVFIIAPISGWNCVESCDCSIYNRDENTDYCIGASCSQMMTPFRSETLFIGGICLLALLFASVMLYMMLLLKVRNKTKKPIKQWSRKTSEIRMIKTMVIVLSGFLLTTGPLAVLCITSYFYNVRHLHFAMRVLVVISNVNSILNPFFYFWRIPQMSGNLNKLGNSFVKMLRNIIFCCPKDLASTPRASVNYSGAKRHELNPTSESYSTGTNVKYLNKTIRLKLKKPRNTTDGSKFSISGL